MFQPFQAKNILHGVFSNHPGISGAKACFLRIPHRIQVFIAAGKTGAAAMPDSGMAAAM